MRIAEVWANLPVKRIAQAYSYLVPEEWDIRVGSRVLVPFGGRKVEGFVLEIKEADGKGLKPMLASIDEEPWFTAQMIEAARWMADFYLCSLAEAMRLFIPGKSGVKISPVYVAEPAEEGHVLLQMANYRMLYERVLEEEGMTRTELKKAFPTYGETLDAMLEKLLSYHIFVKDYAVQARTVARYAKYLSLAAPLTEDLRTEYKRKKAQLALMEFLEAHGEQQIEAVKSAGFSTAIIKQLKEARRVKIRLERVLRDSYREGRRCEEQVSLTEEQRPAVEKISEGLRRKAFGAFLLHGVTGSGKTRVYMEAAKEARKMGRTVLVLVPEIALTGQLVASFQAYFAGDIIVMHSRLSVAERNDAILRVRRGEARVIIGARSALFTPAEDIGLIILDEEQDMSYKQDESPRYHAHVVAEAFAKIHHAVLVLGSATPSMESYHRTQLGELSYLSMPHRVGNQPMPTVSSADMRMELKTGNRKILSRALQGLIQRALGEKKQLIIMLNRRGFSTFVMCRSCGAVISCEHCGLPLVYHRNKTLVCHHCDVQAEIPDVCPKCGSSYIKYFGSGTEKLEEELRAFVPEARVVRMDRDTTGGKFAHQEILTAFKRGAYDILLGTQMVAKGHDVPNVTGVGIISADSSLHMADFRAAERCFMLITQTAGRAGRGEAQGEVVVQTYNPEHYAVQCGMKQDYLGFYQAEIKKREELFYPPFSRLVKLIFQNQEEQTAREEARAFVSAFQSYFKGQDAQQIIGPSPAMIANFRGTYRFVVLIKTRGLSIVQKFLREKELQTRADVLIDIDPITMM